MTENAAGGRFEHPVGGIHRVRDIPNDMQRMCVALLLLFLSIPAFAWGQSSWNDMSRQEREALQKRYREWERLPDGEKAIVEENYRRWKGLPKYEKQELKKRWQFWQGLPKDRRDNLKQQFRQQFRGGQQRKRNR